MELKLTTQSTDANIAMSRGIPAITLASGCGGRMHALDEWIDIETGRSLRSMAMPITRLLASAGMRE